MIPALVRPRLWTSRRRSKTIVALVPALLALTAPPAPASSSPLVSFRQGGGFVALDRSFAVRQSGQVVTQGAVVAKLAPKRLAALRRALADSRWRTLARHYAPRVHVADGYVYTITYRGRAVRIDQGAKLPARLARAVLLLRGLVPLVPTR
jgi:hypothetical protein